MASINSKSPTGNSKAEKYRGLSIEWWLRGLDLNQRPSGYEPDELPDCSTPRHHLFALKCRAVASATLAFLA